MDQGPVLKLLGGIETLQAAMQGVSTLADEGKDAVTAYGEDASKLYEATGEAAEAFMMKMEAFKATMYGEMKK